MHEKVVVTAGCVDDCGCGGDAHGHRSAGGRPERDFMSDFIFFQLKMVDTQDRPRDRESYLAMDCTYVAVLVKLEVTASEVVIVILVDATTEFTGISPFPDCQPLSMEASSRSAFAHQ